jgi:hypothetical protein
MRERVRQPRRRAYLCTHYLSIFLASDPHDLLNFGADSAQQDIFPHFKLTATRSDSKRSDRNRWKVTDIRLEPTKK